MTRQEANKEILSILSAMLEKNPDLRFEQLLVSVGLEWSSFYEESEDTLDIIKNNTNRFEEDEAL